MTIHQKKSLISQTLILEKTNMNMDNFYSKDVPNVKSTTTPTFTVNDFINDMKAEGEHIRTVFEGAIDKIHMREAKFTERPKEWLDDKIPKEFVPEVAEDNS